MSRLRVRMAAAMLCIALAACSVSPERSWVRTELFFGLGEGLEENTSAFGRYLDEAVSPAFPAGFTVLEAQGQWQPEDGGPPKRLRSRVLVILHPGDAASEDRIEDLRAQWIQRSGHESVLRVDVAASAAF